MAKKLRVVDFFCGGGGFSEGFRQAGFELVSAFDIWQPAIDTHTENHPECIAIKADVIEISLLPDKEFENIVPDSEVIIGSPPCTDFSNSNKSGNADKANGIKLIEAYLRIVARKKFKKNSSLKYWILENVPKVQSHIRESYSCKELGLSGGSKLETRLGSSGVYNAKYFGVPSNRLRYFCGEFPRPKEVFTDDQIVPLGKILSDLGVPMEKIHQKIHDPVYGFEMKGEEVTDHHYFHLLANHEKKKIIRLKQDKGYMGRMAVPENSDRPARTIMATMSFSARECFVLGHMNGKLRAPSIREVASLMSFPIDYRFYGVSFGTKYKLVGNAVPPKMAYAFAKAMAKNEDVRTLNAYKKINHAHKIGFVNLNLDEIPIKKEKIKKPSARFKYHIPYFKFDTYRVELTNYHSDFTRLKFIWSAEIHYNQGKDRARTYRPKISHLGLDKNDIAEVKKYISSIKRNIVTCNRFQQIHCLTSSDIEKDELMGPFEFLDSVKSFLTMKFRFDKKSSDYVNVKSEPFLFPRPIAIGYLTLALFTEQMHINDETKKNPN